MAELTREGRGVVRELASRHGFSEDAVAHLLLSVWRGGGAMAMFDHPEFAGPGQWMRGGMLMLSDMFNHALKARVDALCTDIAHVVTSRPELVAGDGGAPAAGAASWPRHLGSPSATGSQNGIEYAYFAGPRRLAVRRGGHLELYDTGDHRISGVAQQQGAGSSLTFTSQHGPVNLNSLPRLDTDPADDPARGGQQRAGALLPGAEDRPPSGAEDVFLAIERLGKLHADGLLSDQEFEQKKAELLARI